MTACVHPNLRARCSPSRYNYRMRRALALLAVAACRYGFNDLPGDGQGSTDSSVPSAFTAITLPPGGNLGSIERATDGTVYAVAAGVRVFSSANNGQSWTACGTPPGPLDGLTLDPTTGAIYGNGETDVLASFDHCATWTSLGFDRNTQGAGIIGSTLVVGADDGTWQWDGTTWTHYSTMFDGESVGNIVVDPINRQRIFIGGANGIEQSLDGGASWTVVNTGLGGLGVEFIVLDAGQPMRVLAETSDGTSTYIYYSLDGGMTWNQVTDAGNSIGIDPSSSNFAILFSWSNSLETSFDGGQTFNGPDFRSASMQVASVNNYLFGASSSVLATTNRGVFSAPDHNLVWTERDVGIEAWTINSITVGDTGTIFLGTFAGVLRSDDGGQSWSESTTGLLVDSNTSSVVQLPTDPNTILTASFGEISKSADHGMTYSTVFTCDQNDDYHVHVARLVAGKIIAGAWADALTSDASWTVFTHRTVGATFRDVRDILALDSTGTMLVAGTEDGVYLSTNGGASFVTASSGLGNLDVNRLALLSDGTLLAGTVSGLYRAPSAGGQWTASGLPTANVADLLVTANHVLAATDGGVFDSPDGLTWTSIHGLEAHYPQSLAFDHSGRLLVGTNGFGLYATPLTP